MKKSQKKDKIKKIQLGVAISLLLVCALMLFKTPGITGHVTADFKTQTLNMVMDESQSFLLTTDNHEPLYITSIRMSGEVIGNGNVEVFVDNNAGQKLLLYRNVMAKERGLPTVTGMAVGTENEPVEGTEQRLLLLKSLGTIQWKGSEISLSENEEYMEGSFNNKCVDTCFIEMTLSSELGYELLFNIQPGTKLRISKIIYTLKDEQV